MSEKREKSTLKKFSELYIDIVDKQFKHDDKIFMFMLEDATLGMSSLKPLSDVTNDVLGELASQFTARIVGFMYSTDVENVYHLYIETDNFDASYSFYHDDDMGYGQIDYKISDIKGQFKFSNLLTERNSLTKVCLN